MKHCNLSQLVAAANAQGCTIHLRQDENSKLVFSVRDSNNGVHEFTTYATAYEYLTRNECADAFAGIVKPKVSVSQSTTRPTIGTLGDVLKQTVDHAPDGFTRIKGSTASRWYELEEERDTLYLTVDAVTACLDIQDDLTVFIRQGVTVDHARGLLKAIAKEIKGYGSFERFTPLVPVSDDAAPF